MNLDEFDFEACYKYVMDNKDSGGRRYLVDEYCENNGMISTPDGYSAIVNIIYGMIEE